MNNADWLATIDLLSFLRDAGKHFTVNYMLQKESVSRRLESEEGISFTEFSYLLLQAYDFLQVFDRYGCTLQMGGSDQWGNITAGVDLIRKLRAKKAHGLVVPLVMTASGVEVRKDRGGHDLARSRAHVAIQVLSVLAEHGRPRRRDVSEVLHVSRSAGSRGARGGDQTAPEKREAQRVLARDVTERVHGSDHVTRAEHASSVLFGEDIATLDADEVLAVFEDVPSTELPRRCIRRRAASASWILSLACGWRRQRREARRLVQSGGVYVNNRRVADPQARLTRDQAIDGRLFVLRKGQKQNHLVRLT